jgi:hypothetical protein
VAQNGSSIHACPAAQRSSDTETDYLAYSDQHFGFSWSDTAGDGQAGSTFTPVIIEHCRSGIVWTEPRDISRWKSASWPSCHSCGQVSLLFADGSVRMIDAQSIIVHPR